MSLTNPVSRLRGFTLVELLLVIALIAVLAALLFPVLSRAKARSRQTACLNNVKQITMGVRVYAEDHADTLPNTGIATFITYREVVKKYVGLNGPSSPQDRIFACPADTFYYDETTMAYSPHGHHEQAAYDYSSYSFNSLNLLTNFSNFHNTGVLPGVGGLTLGSVKNPTKALLVVESPALLPYSWHDPGPSQQPAFDSAKNIVGFVDGHVSYVKIYWNSGLHYPDGTMSAAAYYNPPEGYDYKWSGD